MNIKRFFPRIAGSGNYIAGSALTLVLAIAGEAVGPAEAETAPSREVPPSEVARALDSHAASPGRINGRADWDTDYPSQLAPEAVPSSSVRRASAGVAPPAQGVRGTLSSQIPTIPTQPVP